MDDRAAPIIVEQKFNKPLRTVWKAITEQPQMVRWFFTDIPEFMAEKGFETSFNVTANGRNFHHRWIILEAEAPNKITYHWSYSEIDGEGIVVFELEELPNGTMLRLTNTGLDSFPSDIPEFSRESCLGGWQYFIKGNLKNYLDPEPE